MNTLKTAILTQRSVADKHPRIDFRTQILAIAHAAVIAAAKYEQQDQAQEKILRGGLHHRFDGRSVTLKAMVPKTVVRDLQQVWKVPIPSTLQGDRIFGFSGEYFARFKRTRAPY